MLQYLKFVSDTSSFGYKLQDCASIYIAELYALLKALKYARSIKKQEFSYSNRLSKLTTNIEPTHQQQPTHFTPQKWTNKVKER